MSQVLINESTLQNTANAIRSKTKRETGLGESSSFSLEVLGKYYQFSNSGSGTLLAEIVPSVDWPGVPISYLFVMEYNQDAPFLYNIGDKTHQYNSNHIIITPTTPKSGSNIYALSQSITRSQRINTYVYPLDENMNPIIYDENIHSGMPHRNISREFMLKPKQSSLLYPSDFSLNINSNVGSTILKFTDSPIDIGTTYGYSKGSIPGMDLRYYGINSIQDIKYFQFHPYNYYPFYIIPSWSWTRVDPPTGFEQFGYGYRVLQTHGIGNTAWPYYLGDQALYLKDGRLYGVSTWSWGWYDMRGFLGSEYQQILIV